MTFGENLSKLRREAGLSQEALAEMLEGSRQSVSRWEQDACSPSMDSLIRMGEVLRVPVERLAAGVPAPVPAPEPPDPPAPPGIHQEAGGLNRAGATGSGGALLRSSQSPDVVCTGSGGLGLRCHRLEPCRLC